MQCISNGCAAFNRKKTIACTTTTKSIFKINATWNFWLTTNIGVLASGQHQARQLYMCEPCVMELSAWGPRYWLSVDVSPAWFTVCLSAAAVCRFSIFRSAVSSKFSLKSALYSLRTVSYRQICRPISRPIQIRSPYSMIHLRFAITNINLRNIFTLLLLSNESAEHNIFYCCTILLYVDTQGDRQSVYIMFFFSFFFYRDWWIKMNIKLYWINSGAYNSDC